MGQGKSTTYGYWRQRGDGKEDSFPAVSMLALPFSFTMSSSSVSLGKLPKGAFVAGVVNIPNDVAGAPQYDIGTSTASHGVHQSMLAETDVGLKTATGGGTVLRSELSAQTEIFGRGSDATGGAIISGTAQGAVLYWMNDDGV